MCHMLWFIRTIHGHLYYLYYKTFVMKVPDDSSDDPKHVAYCFIALKCCVCKLRLCFKYSKHNGINLNKIAITSLAHIVNTYKNLKHKVLECNISTYFNICNKSVWRCSWWTKTCSRVLYTITVLYLMIYFVCISRIFHIYKLAM